MLPRLLLCLLVPSLLSAVVIQKEINYVEEIEFQGVGQLLVTQGDRPHMTIEGDEALLHDTRIDVERGKVVILRKAGAFRPPHPQFHCHLVVDNDLNKIVLREAAVLTTERLKLEDVQIEVHDRAVGKVVLEGDDLLCRLFDRGELSIEGKVDTQKVVLEDQANYQAQGLNCRTCSVKVVGEGKAHVQADDKLSAFVVGSGTITYAKEPKELNKKVSGSGQILKD